jgi:hypothetical protein
LIVLATVLPVSAAGGATAQVDVVARLYNTARVADGARDIAVAGATRALARGAIHVVWRDCDVPSACSQVPAAGELVVRLVRSHERSINPAALVLGEASIDRGAGAGVLATIYVNRVELMAELSSTDAAVLLGRAIAHELGHLLLATNMHSASGLMRAQWSLRDLRRNQTADWVLTGEESEAIRRRFR